MVLHDGSNELRLLRPLMRNQLELVLPCIGNKSVETSQDKNSWEHTPTTLLHRRRRELLQTEMFLMFRDCSFANKRDDCCDPQFSGFLDHKVQSRRVLQRRNGQSHIDFRLVQPVERVE